MLYLLRRAPCRLARWKRTVIILSHTATTQLTTTTQHTLQCRLRVLLLPLCLRTLLHTRPITIPPQITPSRRLAMARRPQTTVSGDTLLPNLQRKLWTTSTCQIRPPMAQFITMQGTGLLPDTPPIQQAPHPRLLQLIKTPSLLPQGVRIHSPVIHRHGRFLAHQLSPRAEMAVNR